MSKTDHLAKAKDYIAKGEECYRKAAEEIMAAKAERPELTWARIAEQVECSERQVHRLIAAFRNSDARFTVDWASGSNKRDEVARKVLADPVKRREVIESLGAEDRAELAREIAASTTPSVEPGREDEREVFRSIQEAPDRDLSALAAKFVATASRIEVEMAEGAEFRRMNAKDLQRLDRDLDRVKDTADRLKEQIAAQSRVRRIA